MISALLYFFIFLMISLISKKSSFLGAMLFGVFIGGAYQVGHADYIAYQKLYDVLDLNEVFNPIYYLGHYEPGYMIVLFAFKAIGFSYPLARIFIFSIAFYIFLRCCIALGVKKTFDFLFLLLPMVSFSHFFSIDRQSIALLLLPLALVYKNYICFIFPLSFHYSSAVLLISKVLSKTKFRIFAIIFLGFIILSFFYVLKNSYFYGAGVIASSSSFILVIFYFVFLFFYRRKNPKIYFYAGVLIAFFLVEQAVFYRMKVYLIFLLLLMIFSHFDGFKKNENKIIFLLLNCVFVFSVCLFYAVSSELEFGMYQNYIIHILSPYPSKEYEWRYFQ